MKILIILNAKLYILIKNSVQYCINYYNSVHTVDTYNYTHSMYIFKRFIYKQNQYILATGIDTR